MSGLEGATLDAMAEEIELKFSLPLDEHARLQRHPALKKALSQTNKQLANIYFDTPTLDLHRKGVALRLRRIGDTWVQTIKCAGEQAGGLSSRPEWEFPYSGRFDFSPVGGELGEWLSSRRIAPRLQPVFETNFRRRAWSLKAGSSVLELALDKGWVLAGGRKEAISEVEIEVLSSTGNPDLKSLFDFAESLAVRLPLLPALRSKAERGYGLYLGRPMVPVRAQTEVSPPDTPLAAFRHLALSCLEHLHLNQPGVLADMDPEYLHQMRVATRRLRAAMRLFSPLIPESLDAELLPGLRALAARLGKVRDLDVLLAETVQPAIRDLPKDGKFDALLDRIHTGRATAFSVLRDQLADPAYGVWLMLFLRRMNESPFVDQETKGELLEDFLQRRLKNLRNRVREQAELARHADPETLHDLRIAIKRLRYSLEFFPKQARTGRRLLESLTTLQEDLGQLQDLATAGPLLLSLTGDEPSLLQAVGKIGQWHLTRYDALLKSTRRELKKID